MRPQIRLKLFPKQIMKIPYYTTTLFIYISLGRSFGQTKVLEYTDYGVLNENTKTIVKESYLFHNIQHKISQALFTTKPAGSGSGLGLSICYDIVKAHGGSIDVDLNLDIIPFSQ